MISFSFRLYLMLYTYAVRFDATENLEKLFGFQGELNKTMLAKTDPLIPSLNRRHVKYTKP